MEQAVIEKYNRTSNAKQITIAKQNKKRKRSDGSHRTTDNTARGMLAWDLATSFSLIPAIPPPES